MNFKEIKNKLKNRHVGIAGAGGLGSNAAVALVRVGLGKLTIVDFDLVEESNLNRQFYFHHQIGMKKADAIKENLLQINRGLHITSLDMTLNSGNIPEIFNNCDLVIEAFDRADQKQMLIECCLEKMPDKIVIAGNGMAGWGDFESIKIIKNENLYICGDGVSEISPELPPLAPRVGIVSNMQADIALDLLLKM